MSQDDAAPGDAYRTDRTNASREDHFGGSDADRSIAIALDILPSAALVFNSEDGTVLHVNPTFESLADVQRAEFVGSLVTDFFRDPVELSKFRMALQNNEAVSGHRMKCTLHDGTELWLDTSSRWVFFGGNPAILTMLTNIDIANRALLAAEAEGFRSSALAEISAIIAGGKLENQAYVRVADVVRRLLDFDWIAITLLDSDNSTFTSVFVQGTRIKGSDLGIRPPESLSLVAHVARLGKGVAVHDDDPEVRGGKYPSLAPALDAGLRSFVTVPLKADGHIVGTISIRSKTPHAYDDNSVALVERIASIVAPAIEQFRLQQNLEREASEREIIAEIGRIISSSLDVDSVYERFVELVRQIVPADRLAITSFEAGDDYFTILHHSGTRAKNRVQGQHLPTELSMTGETAETRQPVFFHPVNRDQVEHVHPNMVPLFDAGLRSFMAVPLFIEDRVVGALIFYSKEEHDFSSRHARLAEMVAGQIAGVIAISLARQSERITAIETAAISEIGRIIGSSLNIRSVYEAVAQRVAKILPCDRMVITTLDNDKILVTDAYVYGKVVEGRYEGSIYDICVTPLVEHVVATRQTLVMTDCTKEMDPNSDSHKTMGDSGLKSLILTPLLSDGDVIGTLNLNATSIGAYTPQRIALAERIADQIAGAIANARMYQDLKNADNELRALSAIGLAATQDLELDGVFERAADALRDVIEYDRLSITLIDSERQGLRTAFERGEYLDREHPAGLISTEYADEFDGEEWIWKTGLDNGTRSDGRLVAMVQAPLGSRNQLLGYIRLRSNKPHQYDKSSAELMERVATYLTPAVQNALDHQREIHLAEEREQRLRLDHENRELHRVNEANSRFLSTVSHELKTPLTSITAFTDILLKNRMGSLTDRDLKQLTVIQRNNRRLGNLIGDLLDLSQIDRGGMILTMSEFDVSDLVIEVTDAFRPVSDSKSQNIVISTPNRSVSLRGDRDRLVQVLTNLLSNASKYSPEGTSIGVIARRWKDRIYFSVSDKGIGISDQNMESLFTLFYRVDNEDTRSVPGTGIGLFIARSIVELHGGDIDISSSPGDGSVVSFYMPGAFTVSGDAKQQTPIAEILPWSRLDEQYEQAAS